METKLEDVVALITGGASGIGKSIAEMIIKNGGKVVIADISLQGKNVALELGENASFFETEVSSEEAVDKVLQFLKLKYGKLNVVVNCAGIAEASPVYDFVNNKPHSADIYKKIFDVNTFGTLNVMSRSIGLMKENNPDENGQRGVIINIGSIAGFGLAHEFLAYGASKAAIMAMTEAAARHVAQVGIRVVAIAPGAVDTPLTRSIASIDMDVYLIDQMYPKRVGRPEEIAHLIKCIIENNFINAEIIRIDAGTRARNF